MRKFADLCGCCIVFIYDVYCEAETCNQSAILDASAADISFGVGVGLKTPARQHDDVITTLRQHWVSQYAQKLNWRSRELNFVEVADHRDCCAVDVLWKYLISVIVCAVDVLWKQLISAIVGAADHAQCN